ncbi:MAG: transketolase [Candidatus Babeliales bacterium]|jgi:transketolase
MLNKEQILYLKHQALNLRIDSIRATVQSKSGHPTSCLSIADIVSTIFFNFLRYDLKNPKYQNNDRVILSKGHAIPVIYAAWKQLSVISDDELLTLRKFTSPLEGHPTPRFAYNEATTGSLGQGLSVGLGMALAARMDKLDYTTYVLMGDGEIAEGSIWEAAELAAFYNIDNLIGFVDCNRLGQTGQTLHEHQIQNYVNKFQAFGWKTLSIDGHDISQIVDAINIAKSTKNQPTMIIAKTFKGHGLEGIEDELNWHGKPLSQELAEKAIAQLKIRFKEESEFKPSMKYATVMPTDIKTKKTNFVQADLFEDINKKYFEKNALLSTRKAYGYALQTLGENNPEIVALDADVSNSTFEEFFAKKFPERFIQCFIAEQNMISVSTGLQTRGKIPFAATFAAFLTRAFDQLRMAGIGQNALRICGSHCGVSIGQDGPSQMGLEDIAMFNAIPNSIILYPSDAVCTYKLMNQCAVYNDGISYLRTTRADTQIIYDIDEKFEIGKCKVLRQSCNDICCIVAAGITLHEALNAYDLLKAEGIFVSVIDLYSIKPMDIETIVKIAQNSNNKIISVEDHYINGGIGQILAGQIINSEIKQKMLGVTKISRSGTPEELMHDAGIEAHHIIKTVKEFD